MSLRKVKCPNCKKTVQWDENNRWRPFCSERCRIIDLGAWADESHRIPDATPADFVEHSTDQDSKPH